MDQETTSFNTVETMEETVDTKKEADTCRTFRRTSLLHLPLIGVDRGGTQGHHI